MTVKPYDEAFFDLNGYDYYAKRWTNGVIRVWNTTRQYGHVETFSLRVIAEARRIFTELEAK